MLYYSACKKKLQKHKNKLEEKETDEHTDRMNISDIPKSPADIRTKEDKRIN